MEPYSSLAKEWWRNRRPGGYFDQPESAPGADISEAQQVESDVDRLAGHLETLGPLLECIAREAASSDELRFVGTWFLEDASEMYGEAAFDLLDSLDLPAHTKAEIRSGVL
ncbi:hypothetical protein J7E25_14035 [Agromyces sp. ISL-38]|uniref:hypothetical protein n=1 Tax=Agromyces sp. ISL-38 TaxID=2819107 RepID=UPI001BE67AE3|nr:hypothetical protein [Agromyces sp. ISL-38]MBT2500209.1 hypothetical protein [Agromyces sp. ISL-38]